MHRNAARSLGSLSQLPGTNSRWKSSPDFRLGYNVPNNFEDEGHAFFLCDLQEETFRKIRVEGGIRGWWDERHLLIKVPSGDFVLYDVFNGQTSGFLGLEIISKKFKESGISYPS